MKIHINTHVLKLKKLVKGASCKQIAKMSTQPTMWCIMEKHLQVISLVKNVKNPLQVKGFLSKHIKYSMCDTMKNFECQHCWKKYKKKESLDKHMLLHFPRKKCNLCNLLLSRDKLLIAKHMNMHFHKIKLKKARSFKRKTILWRGLENISRKSGHINPAPQD